MRSLPFLLLFNLVCPAWAAHGYALWGDLKYPANFAHFDYVNAAAKHTGIIICRPNDLPQSPLWQSNVAKQ